MKSREYSDEIANAESMFCVNELKMIDRMELFGFDVRRVMDIMELNKYVPTVDKDVDFWVLKYLSCKLMNYTEGTCSVLLHVVKQ